MQLQQALNPAALSAFEDRLRTIVPNVVNSLEPECRRWLTSTEQQLLTEVQAQPYDPRGAWFRPYHNLVVPMAALKILRLSGMEKWRHLVSAAIVHDVGYGGCEVSHVGNGDRVDLRIAHMDAGDRWVKDRFKKFPSDTFTVQEVDDIRRIARTHDNPYIDWRELPSGPRDAIHRDADRVFVMSAASFWKDVVAHLCSPEKQLAMRCAGCPQTPIGVLQLRMASFYRFERDLPDGWDVRLVPLNREFATLNPGGRPEPQRTLAGAEAVNNLFQSRLAEIAELRPGQLPEINTIAGTIFKELKENFMPKW